MNYSGTGSGTNTLTFTYTIAGGENSLDLDYTSVGALTRMGNGHITDALGNEVVYTTALPTPGGPGSLGFNKDIVIDTIAPTIAAFSCLPGTTPTNATSLNCSVTFSESVIGFDSTTGDVTVGGASSAWTKGASAGTGAGPYTFTVSRGAPNSDGTLPSRSRQRGSGCGRQQLDRLVHHLLHDRYG